MKKTTIIVQGKPFTYEDELSDICYATIGEITKEEGFKLLELTKKLFSQQDIFFSLAYGTLLGAIRENGIIPGDEDVDVFTNDEQRLYDNLPFLQENGLCICRIVPGSLYSFRAGGKHFIDVYIQREFKKTTLWRLWCYNMLGKAIPKSCFKSYKPIAFIGGYYNAPINPEKVLRIWYGDSWETPIKGHGLWKSEVSSHYYWRTKIKPFISNLIKKIKGGVK